MLRALKSFSYFLIFSTILCTFTANANVSLKNGNFFIGYTDLVYPGGMEPKIERVYNSKSSYDGIFGFGWGSEFEVYLKTSADGSVVIYENGGGAQNRFTSPSLSSAEVDKAVEKIIEAKKKSGGLSGSLAETEKNRLKTDARYRNDEFEKLYSRGLVKAREIADGVVLNSNKFSHQTLKKTNNGYVRYFDNGQVQTFDNEGHLVRWADKNRNYLTLGYDKRGYLSYIQDNLNRRMNFTVDAKGKIEKVTYDKGKYAEYKYNSAGELTYSKDVDGNVYEYRYSSNGRHNLVEIKYTDNTTLQLGYHDMNKCENVKWVKERDGTVTQYDYGGKCDGGLEHITSTVMKSSDGKTLGTNKYEYYEKSKADGERYTFKLVSVIDGDRTETVYNECCGLPIEITKNDMKTTFEYDKLGHVVKKSTPRDVTMLTYDSNVNKVSKVVKMSKIDKSKRGTSWSTFKYDSKGNLIEARNSDGKAAKLVYDATGRIRAMVDQDKRKLQFTYNEANRPVEIRDPALGAIKVQYGNSGEIKKVDTIELSSAAGKPKNGRKIAAQVTSAFQNLLDIIRPAGVTLSF